MNRHFQKYSIVLVTFMVILYSVFAELKMNSEPTLIYPYYGLYMALVLIPIILSFALEKYLPKYIDILKYIRLVTSIVMILLIVLILFRFQHNNNNIFNSTYLYIDYMLGGFLVILLVASSTLEDMFYSSEEVTSKLYFRRLGIKSLVFINLISVFSIGIVFVLIFGLLGVSV